MAGEDQRGEQVIRPTTGHPRHEVRRSGRDQHEIGPAREFDMPHRGLGRRVPQLRPHLATRNGLERGGRDKALCAGRHDDLHLGTAFAQAADEIGGFVCRNAPAHPEQDPTAA
jgi:hypothetical protein